MSVWVNVGADQDYSELTLLALRAVAAGAATLSRPAAGRTRLTRPDKPQRQTRIASPLAAARPSDQRRCAPLSNIAAAMLSNKGLNPKESQPKKRPLKGAYFLAGRPGFEPGLAESESAVLPLDDLPIGVYAGAINAWSTE